MSSNRSYPYIVALTGGIASGKSAVCNFLATLGVPILDADIVARELVAPNQPASIEIRQVFGDAVFAVDGTLNRSALRERIFQSASDKKTLEAVLHPRVRTALRERAIALREPYVVLAIPLLVESGHYDWVDCVVVVDVETSTQIARLIKRDKIEQSLAFAMLNAQAKRSDRIHVGDILIRNDADVKTLQIDTETLHSILLARAQH